jgi:hypothetical protein
MPSQPCKAALLRASILAESRSSFCSVMSSLTNSGATDVFSGSPLAPPQRPAGRRLPVPTRSSSVSIPAAPMPHAVREIRRSVGYRALSVYGSGLRLTSR